MGGWVDGWIMGIEGLQNIGNYIGDILGIIKHWDPINWNIFNIGYKSYNS